jgi:hypothetical protein
MLLSMRVSRMACTTAIVKINDSISPGDLESSPFPEVKSARPSSCCIDPQHFREIAFNVSYCFYISSPEDATSGWSAGGADAFHSKLRGIVINANALI